MDKYNSMIGSKSLNIQSRRQEKQVEEVYKKFNMTNGRNQYNFEFSKEFFE